MPENAFFYQLAYGVTIVVYAAYGISLVVRRRALAHRRARAAGTAGIRGA
jgi:heme exporter protein D